MTLQQAVASAQTRGKVLRGFLVACLATDAVAIPAGVLQMLFLSRAASGAEITDAQANANDLFYSAAGIAQMIVALPTIVIWLLWMHRSYRALSFLGTGATDQTPGWAVGYWFIPVVNLWKPYQLTAEMWRRNASGNQSAEGHTPPLLLAWWIVWLLSGVLGRAVLTQSTYAETIPQLQSLTLTGLLGDSVNIIASVLAFFVVLGIDRLQRDAAVAQTSFPAAPLADPDGFIV